MVDTPAHNQNEAHYYVVHFPAHSARPDDPHYKDFNAYHQKTRLTARCYIGQRVGFGSCRDEKGDPCPAPISGEQLGLELHHAHIEFALQNNIDLAVLEIDYPGVSNIDEIGAWVESGQNFQWLCVFHHRMAGGAHTASYSDWEASKYIYGMIGDK